MISVETYIELEAELARMREALKRLGSMEAMTISRAVDLPHDEELIARIDYARTILQDTTS